MEYNENGFPVDTYGKQIPGRVCLNIWHDGDDLLVLAYPTYTGVPVDPDEGTDPDETVTARYVSQDVGDPALTVKASVKISDMGPEVDYWTDAEMVDGALVLIDWDNIKSEAVVAEHEGFIRAAAHMALAAL